MWQYETQAVGQWASCAVVACRTSSMGSCRRRGRCPGWSTTTSRCRAPSSSWTSWRRSWGSTSTRTWARRREPCPGPSAKWWRNTSTGTSASPTRPPWRWFFLDVVRIDQTLSKTQKRISTATQLSLQSCTDLILVALHIHFKYIFLPISPVVNCQRHPHRQQQRRVDFNGYKKKRPFKGFFTSLPDVCNTRTSPHISWLRSRIIQAT